MSNLRKDETLTEVGSAPAAPSRFRKWIKRSLIGAGAFLVLFAATIGVLRLRYHGGALGEVVGTMISEDIRGTVVVGSIEWSVASVPKAAIAGWLPIIAHDVEVYDEFGDLVLKTPLARAELNVHAVLGRRRDMVFRRIVVPDGGYAKIKQVREPYPENEFDHNVVSLISAFYPDRPPEFRAGLGAKPGNVWDLRDYAVTGVTLEVDFPEFHAILYGVSGAGGLRADASDPLAKKLYYTLTPHAPIGVLSFGTSYEVLTDIEISRLALVPGRFPSDPFPRDLEYELTALASGGANVHLRGAMLDHRVDFYGGEHDIDLTVEDAALASMLIIRDFSPASTSDIAADSVQVKITGPVAAPRVAMTVKDVDYTMPSPIGPEIALHVANAVASFDLATESGSLEDTVVRGLGGQVELAASFGLRPNNFDAHLTVSSPLELRAHLPPSLVKAIGSTLSGSLHAVGDGNIQRLEEIDIKLGRASVGGMAYRTQSGLIAAEGLRLELDRTVARDIWGSVNLKTSEIDLNIRRIESTELGRLLRRFGYPALAESVRGHVHVGGTVENTYARGELDFGGVPIVSEVATQFSFGNKTLTLDSATASGYGGSLSASGKIDLRGRPVLRGVTLTGRNLALERVPGVGGQLTGTADIDAEVSGPTSGPVGSTTIQLKGWTVAGDQFQDATLSGSLDAGGGVKLATVIERKDGGRLIASGGLTSAGRLEGDVELASLPVAGILALAGLRTQLAGGTISSKLVLSGRPNAPTASGVVAATRAWFGEAFIGAANVRVDRVDDGVVSVRGELLQGRVQFDGTIATSAPFSADIDLRFHRIEADQFAPALAREFGTRAWVSGSIAYRGDLLPTRRQPSIALRLTEVEALVDNEDTRGRPAPLRVQAISPIEISFDGTNATLVSNAVFSLPGGRLTLAGSLKGEELEITAEGTLALGILGRYFADKFDEIRGEVGVNISLAGTVAKPRVRGTFELRKLAVKPTGQDASVKVEFGLINISDTSITTTGIELVVADEFSDEAASLNVGLTASLDGFSPGEWAVHIDGDLGGKMLLAFAPHIFSAASGRAELDMTVTGNGWTPVLSGEIYFGEENSLAITPRGLRREIRLTGGSITLRGDNIRVSEVSGTIDDEGQITGLDGDISLDGFKPVSLDLDVSARDVPFRIPGVLLLAVNINGGRVIGNFEPDTAVEDRLTLIGRIEIVDGRYIERWSPVINNLRPQRVTESEPPIWERVPLIGNARLSMRIASPAFFVRNNIADITMTGAVTLEGTPLEPRIEGVIRVDQGAFKIPGVRAEFIRTTGTVSFSKFRDFPTSTPEVDITSESDYRDLRGQNHLVQMRLTGPVENLSWDLSTAAGLNRAQTLTLVFSGRTPADARRLFGDEPIGRRPGEYDQNLSTVDSEGTAAVLDRVAKDLVGDQLDRILGDPIKNLTKLDVVRFEVGTASLGMHLEKDVTESFRLLGDAERTLRGWTAALSAENRFNDTVSIEANGLEKRFDDETLEDQRDLKLRLTWRKVLLP